MEAKLIKGKNSGEYMINLEGVGYVTTYESTLPHKLSLKNCQAIERGYDLDELAKSFAESKSSHPTFQNTHIRDFKEGFQAAMEILGDKKFSEEDIKKMMKSASYGWFEADFDKHLATLQQTEWDVIVETKKVIDETKIVGSVKGVKGSGNKVTTYKSVPKLDVDGCLMLKRI